MWLSTPNSREGQDKILAKYFEKLIQDYALNPASKTTIMFFGDDVVLRNCQPVL